MSELLDLVFPSVSGGTSQISLTTSDPSKDGRCIAASSYPDQGCCHFANILIFTICSCQTMTN